MGHSSFPLTLVTPALTGHPGALSGRGYPELYGKALSECVNAPVYSRCAGSELPCIAECGGFMCLTGLAASNGGFCRGEARTQGTLFDSGTFAFVEDTMLCRAGRYRRPRVSPVDAKTPAIPLPQQTTTVQAGTAPSERSTFTPVTPTFTFIPIPPSPRAFTKPASGKNAAAGDITAGVCDAFFREAPRRITP